MNFVWVYWEGGAQSDEIRWSMRSVVDCYPGARLTIVGCRPKWYSGHCIEMKRKGKGIRDAVNKLIVAVNSNEVDQKFMWMMDDIYLMRPFDFRPRYLGTVTKKLRSNNRWQRLKSKTAIYLGGECKDTATHAPHVVDKAKLLPIIDRCLRNDLYIWELIYHHEHSDPLPMERDYLYRVRRKLSTGELMQKDARIINNGNQGWSDSLRTFLREKFPTPTEHELSLPDMSRQLSRLDRACMQEIDRCLAR